MAWIDRLAQEISDVSGTPVSAEQLYSEFEKFRADCKDPVLKDSYPTDIRHFMTSDRPQASTKDIILSFMDQKYPDVSVPATEEIARWLEQEAKRGKKATELERVLAKERVRRYADTERDSYWGINRERLIEKYAGLYALLRIDSRKKLRAEAFALAVKPNDPTMVSAYWDCEDEPRVGDLLVNSYRLSGTTLCRSTDRVIEPVSVSLLRTGRDDGGDLLVLGGFVVGWKSTDPAALFHSRIALIKLRYSVDVSSGSRFDDLLRDQRLHTLLSGLLKHQSVDDDLRKDFLRKADLAMGPLEAKNACPGLVTHDVELAK